MNFIFIQFLMISIFHFCFADNPGQGSYDAEDVKKDSVSGLCQQYLENSQLFDKCIDREGAKKIKEEEEVKAAKRLVDDDDENSSPAKEKMTCNPQKASRVCTDLVVSSTKAVRRHDEGATNEVKYCREACTPGSYIARKNLACDRGGEGTVNYGVAISTMNTSRELCGAAPLKSVKDHAEIAMVENGFCEVEQGVRGNGVCKRELSQGVIAEVSKVRGQEDVVKYRGTDGKLYNYYEDAVAYATFDVSAEASPSSVKRLKTADNGFMPEGFFTESKGVPAKNAELQLPPSEAVPTHPTAKKTVPVPGERPSNQNISTGSEKANRGNASNASAQDPSPRDTGSPSQAPQPLTQQASQSDAFLQNSLNSPTIKAGSSMDLNLKNTDSSDSSEVTSGSGGRGAWSGAGAQLGGFKGGKIPDHPRDVIDGGRVPVTPGSVSSPTLAGSGSGRNFSGLGGGVNVASNNRNSAVDRPYQSEGFRSDQFYKVNGRGATNGYRQVKADPNCRGKNCAMKRVRIGKSSKSCDGKPECIAKKINAQSVLAKMKQDRMSDSLGKGSRSLASVSSASKAAADVATFKKLPEGVWRGYKDILVHMDNLGSSFLKLDHEGFLDTSSEVQP